MALRFHVFLCALCRTYQTQIDAVCSISHHAGASPSSHGAGLPPQRKRAMQDAIDRSRS